MWCSGMGQDAPRLLALAGKPVVMIVDTAQNGMLTHTTSTQQL